MREFGKGKTLLQLINRQQFDELCEKWNLDKGVRKFSTWEQTCTHVIAYLMRLESLREIEGALFIPRSTFSDANAKRCSGFFQDLCELVLNQIQMQSSDRKVRRAIKQLLLLDSTECRVHGSLSNLPLWHLRASEGLNKASVKIQAIWNVEGEWIDDFRITPNRTSDVRACLKFEVKPNSIYIFDRGYFDILFWWKIIEGGSDFITRLKDSPARRRLRAKVLKQNINKDGVLWEGSCSRAQSNLLRLPKEAREIHFRHIIYRDPETKKVFDFATSDFSSAGQTIADLYKKRWGIELLFRWLKSHLNIRYFPSKNVNAVEIQAAIAILVQLLVRLHRGENKQNTLWKHLRKIRIDLIHDGLTNSTLRGSIGSKYFTKTTLRKPRFAG